VLLQITPEDADSGSVYTLLLLLLLLLQIASTVTLKPLIDRDMSGNDIACNGQSFCKVRLGTGQQHAYTTWHSVDSTCFLMGFAAPA
jgi:uncharacterized membrane protein YhaH (DUF805 family)